MLGQHLYVHGGFEHDSPNVPTNQITKVDIAEIFKNTPVLYKNITPNEEKQDLRGGGEGMLGQQNNPDQIGKFPTFRIFLTSFYSDRATAQPLPRPATPFIAEAKDDQAGSEGLRRHVVRSSDHR